MHDVHRTATTLLADAAAGPAPAEPVFALRDFLVATVHHHHVPEDDVLWPRLAKADPEAAQRLESLSEEHDALEAGLAALAEVTGDRARLAAAAVAVRDLVHTHLEHEEPVLFPVLRKHMPDDEWTA